MLKTPILMPNKPWLIDRVLTSSKLLQIFLWVVFRGLNKIINLLPWEVNIRNLVINHKYFLNDLNWHSASGEQLFGYFGLIVHKNGIGNELRILVKKIVIMLIHLIIC